VALISLIKPRAAKQIEAAAIWWRDNRPAAPGAIRLDLEAAIEVLVENPGIGTRVENSRDSQARRLYLARTQYFLYYRPRGRYLEIVAFWHSSRERGPKV
jgi:plasmid stabilization system protein ParE